MRAKLLLTLAVIGLCTSASIAHAVEVFKWNRVPLPIQLSVGHERIVFIDRNVSVGAPRSLTGKLRIQSVAGAVYLLANEAFPPSRLQLRDDESGEIILLDIATTDNAGQLEPAKVVTGDRVSTDAQGDSTGQASKEPAVEASPARTPAPVALTRYAAQMMYAPLRTVEALPHVQQVPVRLTGHIQTLAPTLDIDAVALGAWSLGSFTVTAVRLVNRRHERLQLDPRHLQGDLYAATFQHNDLGPAGTPADTTTVYVVTRDKSLELALPPAPSVGVSDRE
ncbi:TIGR03749 family integrating conjugative element protein [Pseudomonas sp. NCHU5208]|uniref:TIGR03749 family integrating conjugative element protein n=1 Tax=unclassified Pseudomonas TaxID=196821 RepID=UPI003F95231D